MNLTHNIITQENGWQWFRFYEKDKTIPLHTLVVSPATKESNCSAVYCDMYIDGHTVEFKKFYFEPVDDIYSEMSMLLGWIASTFPQVADIVEEMIEICPELGYI